MKVFSISKVRVASLGGALAMAGTVAGIMAPGSAQAQFFYPRGYYVEPYEDEEIRPPAYVSPERLYPAPYGRELYERRPAPRALVQPHEVIDIAQSEYGLRGVGRPRLRGRVYLIDGIDRSGRQVRLTVSAIQGTILNAERIEPVAVSPPSVNPPLKPRPEPRAQEPKPREAALPPKPESKPPEAKPKVLPAQPQVQMPSPAPKTEQPAAATPAAPQQPRSAPQNSTAQNGAPAPRVVLPNPMEANKMPTLVEPAPLDEAKPKASPAPSSPTPYVPPATLE